jgi:hypothetical protein
MIFGLFKYALLYLSNNNPLFNWLARYVSWNLTALRQDVRRLGNLLGNSKFTVLLVKHIAPSQRNPFKCAL